MILLTHYFCDFNCLLLLLLFEIAYNTRYYCVKFYNALPLHLKNMGFKSFKQHFKQLLTENVFYSFEKFFSFMKSLYIFFF
jgi:ferritin